MPDQLAPIYDAANKALLGSILFSAALTPPSLPVPQPTQNEVIEYLLSSSSWENLFFDQNVTISILKCDAEAHAAAHIQSDAAIVGTQETVAERFHRLAAEWTRETQNVSSLTAMVAHSKYRQIIDLKWDAVPLMLVDLQKNRGFWFPALKEITGIQPFDPSDAGNSERMIKAWVQWGKRKQLI